MQLLRPIGECVGGSEPQIPFAFPDDQQGVDHMLVR